MSSKGVCEGTRIPRFLADQQYYLSRLNYVIDCNGLTEKDLREPDPGCEITDVVVAKWVVLALLLGFIHQLHKEIGS